MQLVTRVDDSGVAVLTLNRPETLNALSPNLFNELRAHIDDIAAATDTVGCVILRGEGRSFSAGNDLKAIQAGEKPPSPHFQAETLDAIERLPQPVIAAVQGHCYTGALELAIACDLLVAADTAKFSDTHGKWGMSPTWGMSQRLPRRVGLLAAKEMMFSGQVKRQMRWPWVWPAIVLLKMRCWRKHWPWPKPGNSWFTLRAAKCLSTAA